MHTMHPSRTPTKGNEMNFSSAVPAVFRKYAEFSGRAPRSEFWWWLLFTTLVGTALGLVSSWTVQLAGGALPWLDLAALWGLVVLLPSLAVQVRRLRDAGFGWGHVFWVLLPVAGLIILAALSAQPSQRDAARAPADHPALDDALV
jgi:uncharacterized membrane protein YhaH (DUF805 family)